MSNDPYYSRPEISNSDLSMLKAYWQPKGQVDDMLEAWRFGTLVDSLITQPDKVNTFHRTCEDYIYTADEMMIAQGMHKSYMRDPFCNQLHMQSVKQKIIAREKFEITYGGKFRFHMPMRCMFDEFIEAWDMSGEIKSTSCTTEKAFIESIFYFEYDRQGSLYMDLAERSNHMIIGISKVEPFPIFKVPLKRGTEMFNRGQENYQDIAFKYWSLLGNWPDIITSNQKNPYGKAIA